MIKILRYLLVIISLSISSIILNAQSIDLLIFDRPTSALSYSKESEHKLRDSLSVITKLERKLYKNLSKGYILCGYDSIVWDSTKVQAYFTYNDKYNWKHLDYSNLINLDGKQSKLKFPNKNQVFNHETLFKNINNALEYYSDQGFPFCKITIDSLIFKNNKVSAKLNIDKGERYYFDSIIIKGDTKLKNYYFQKLTNIKKGEVFSNSKIKKINSLINSITFIEQTNDYQLAFYEDKISLLLYLEDKKLSYFNGIIGIIPNNKTSKQLLITGDLDLSLVNTIGFGENLELRWQKYESHSQNLITKVSIPYILKTNFGFGSNFYLEKKDSSYLNTDVSAIIIYGNKLTSAFELFYRNKSSFLINNENPNDISDYSTNLIGLNYRFSKTDNKLNHRKGFTISMSSALGTKSLESASQNDYDKKDKNILHNITTINISKFIPLGQYMSLSIQNKSSLIYSPILKENELDYIGGLNTIRGFNEKSLPSSSYSILNTDLKYHFDEESALFAFLDIAYLEKRHSKFDSQDFILGSGIGLDLQTNIGIFSLVYAIGKQNNTPYNFNNSKIHFGYKNIF